MRFGIPQAEPPSSCSIEIMTQSAEREARDEALDLERFFRQVRGLRTVARSEIDKVRGKEILKPRLTTNPAE
jgi:hypothetical protein